MCSKVLRGLCVWSGIEMGNDRSECCIVLILSVTLWVLFSVSVTFLLTYTQFLVSLSLTHRYFCFIPSPDCVVLL